MSAIEPTWRHLLVRWSTEGVVLYFEPVRRIVKPLAMADGGGTLRQHRLRYWALYASILIGIVVFPLVTVLAWGTETRAKMIGGAGIIIWVEIARLLFSQHIRAETRSREEPTRSYPDSNKG